MNPALPAGPSLTRFPELAAEAALLLRSPPALIGLSPAEAVTVVAAMQLVDLPKGTVLLREGDVAEIGCMYLLLSGEVSVELDHAAAQPVPISVLGAGSLVGEMSLLDGQPRSTHCVTLSRVQAALLTREALDAMVVRQPQVAARLLAEMASVIANRLRAMADQMRIYARLARTQQAEIERLKARALPRR